MKILKPIEFESVSRAEARLVLVGAPRVVHDNWSDRRSVRKEEPLCPETRQWIQDLPTAVQPLRLAKDYSRIANRICELWNDPPHCTRYLDDLMFVRRGDRKGFPQDVAAEVGALNVHYLTLHPPGRPWT
jgi:hypothetical protein